MARSARAASLEIEDVRHAYGELAILDGVTMSARPGEIVCLLGASGSGKTTLLRIAAGVERPSSGRVILDGREVAGPGGFVPPEQRGVGLMFQDYALFPHLTVLQNVMFGLKHLPAVTAREIAMAAIEPIGLTQFAGDYPHMLSGGEQQRVALARALAPEPGILLMDEPFSNLDQRLREQVREQTILLLREQGTTAVVVTHDPQEAMQIADRIVLMRHGAIAQSGTSEKLYQQPASVFAARFFCDFNEVRATCRDQVADCVLGRFAAPGVPDGPAIVCIRPQSVRLAPAGGAAVEGTILSRRFLGDAHLVLITLAGLERPMHARLPVRAGTGGPGERTGIAIEPGGVLVFAVS